MKAATPKQIWIARGIAIGADCVQLAIIPLFGEGFASPLNAGVDLAVCALMFYLVGWHLAFLPSFLIEGLPLVDLAPTWTIAVLIATRKANMSGKVKPTIDVETEPVPPRIPTEKQVGR